MYDNDKLKSLFYEKCKYHSQFQPNFILSHIETIAAFISDEDLYTGIFAILDTDFNILYSYRTSAYINSCGISDNGKYAIFNTANSETDDSGKCFFVDIEDKTLVWKKPLRENWKSIASYHIDTNSETITVIHREYEVKYSFSGDILDENKFFKQKLTMSDYSPYSLKEDAEVLMGELETYPFDSIKITKILLLLDTASQNPKMSVYQLGLAYRHLGEKYLEFGAKTEAKQYLQKALNFYPKLPIKKILQSL